MRFDRDVSLGTCDQLTYARKLVTLSSSVLGIGAYAVVAHGSSPPHRQSIAVIGFHSLTADDKWGNAITTGITEELREVVGLDLVSGEDVAHLKMDLQLPEADDYDVETLARIRAATGAKLVLVGSYVASPNGSVRLFVNSQDTDTAKTTRLLAEEGPERDVTGLIVRAAASVRRKLGLHSAPPEANVSPRSVLPASSEALRFYAEGRAARDAWDQQRARTMFEQAIAIEPQYAPAHAELAEALNDTGREREAEREIDNAERLSAGMPVEQRLLIQGEYYDIHHQYARAAQAYGQLYDMYPDNLYYGVLLISVQDARNRLTTVEKLRKLLPAPQRDDPRLDVWEANAAGNLDDYRREAAAAARAFAKAKRSPARGQLAEAVVQMGIAEVGLGHPDKATAYFAEAEQVNEAMHDRIGAARCLRWQAMVRRDTGDLETALKLNRRILSIGEKIGSNISQARTLEQIGDIYSLRGSLADADVVYYRALALWEKENSKINQADQRLGIGFVASKAGEVGHANTELTRALTIFRMLGSKAGQISALCDLGTVARESGNIPAASHLIDEAAMVVKDEQDQAEHAIVHASQARLFRAQGSLDAALHAFRSAHAEYASAARRGDVASVESKWRRCCWTRAGQRKRPPLSQSPSLRSSGNAEIRMRRMGARYGAWRCSNLVRSARRGPRLRLCRTNILRIAGLLILSRSPPLRLPPQPAMAPLQYRVYALSSLKTGSSDSCRTVSKPRWHGLTLNTGPTRNSWRKPRGLGTV